MPDLVRAAELGGKLLEKITPGTLTEVEETGSRVAQELFAKAPGGISDTGGAEGSLARIVPEVSATKARDTPALQPDSAGFKLGLVFSHNPAAQARLSELPAGFHNHALSLLGVDAQSFSRLIEEQLTRGTPTHLLMDFERPFLLKALETTYSPETLDALQHLELQHKRVLYGAHVMKDSQTGRALVQRLLDEGAPAAHFEGGRLRAQFELEQLLASDSPTMHKLLELEANSGLDLQNAARLKNAAWLEHLVGKDNAAERINELGHFTSPFPDLSSALGTDAAALERAAELHDSEGLYVRGLTKFIDGKPERAQVVGRELSRGASLKTLENRRWLPGIELVTRHLGSDSGLLDRVIGYGEQNRLSPWQLGSFIDAAPGERVPAVKRLLESGSTDSIVRLMRLPMFSGAVSEKIADASAGGITKLERIVHHARDLEYGANFVELTAREAERGTQLTAKVIEELAHEAKVSQPLASAFTTYAPDERRQAMSVGTELQLLPFADRFGDATKAILSSFAPDQTIVLLGRDMNSFTPVLRAHGRTTIDFHLSRLQFKDDTAALRWKEEVPPNAVVIDSGFSGNMHDKIRSFDRTVKPYMMESHGRYPQLLKGEKMDGFADDLEIFPKLTGRCSGYRPSGAAICRLRNEDDQDYVRPSATASAWNRALLQELGLSNWYVWRYSHFTAIPRAERIGISSPERIQSYLESVEALRNQK